MDRFTEFTRERRYLHNVSPATLSWYTHAFKWLLSQAPTQDELKKVVMRMREKGLKETGCNAVIRAVNAQLHWNNGFERRCGAGCVHLRLSQLKEPQNILPTLSELQVKELVSWTSGKEGLSAAVASARAALARHRLSNQRGARVARSRCGHGKYAHYPRRQGPQSADRPIQFRAPEGLRRGGSLFHLQKVLGHSTLEMTRRYSNRVTVDLQAVHQRVLAEFCMRSYIVPPLPHISYLLRYSAR